MALTLSGLNAVLAAELRRPQKAPRVDLVQEPDSYYEELGKEIDERPIGVPRRRGPVRGSID